MDAVGAAREHREGRGDVAVRLPAVLLLPARTRRYLARYQRGRYHAGGGRRDAAERAHPADVAGEIRGGPIAVHVSAGHVEDAAAGGGGPGRVRRAEPGSAADQHLNAAADAIVEVSRATAEVSRVSESSFVRSRKQR